MGNPGILTVYKDQHGPFVQWRFDHQMPDSETVLLIPRAPEATMLFRARGRLDDIVFQTEVLKRACENLVPEHIVRMW